MTPRAPRILIISELFPQESWAGVSVFGAYQRLRRNLDAINAIAHVDAIYLSHSGLRQSQEEIEAMRLRMLPQWPIPGRITVVESELAPVRPTPGALIRTLRGAVSFTYRVPAFEIFGASQARQIREAIRASKPDLIFVHRLGAMAAILCSQAALPPLVMDMDDIEHVRIARMAANAQGLKSRLRIGLFMAIARRSARNALRRARVSFVCSEGDRRLLSAMVPDARIEVVPNGTQPVELPPPVQAPTAIFIGAAYYKPNQEAIDTLILDIWPRVRRLVPAAELTVMGHGALTFAKSDPENGIIVFDFEPGVGPFYRNARISVCPIRTGGGTRVKIIEAAMHARPVVATTIGAEGLNFTHGSEILIADSHDAFAEACAALFLDAARCEQIGLAARKRALDEYVNERIAARISGIVGEVLNREKSDR